MINFILRSLIGLAIATGLFMVAFNYLHVPKDRFLPPGMVLDDMTQHADGTETSKRVGDYTDHWYTGGVNYQWYESYTFKPQIMKFGPDGKEHLVQSDQEQAGQVEISREHYEGLVDGETVTVSYDPWNPAINGVHDSIGHISSTAGFFGPWMWYVIGWLALGFGLGGAMFKLLPSGIGD